MKARLVCNCFSKLLFMLSVQCSKIINCWSQHNVTFKFLIKNTTCSYVRSHNVMAKCFAVTADVADDS